MLTEGVVLFLVLVLVFGVVVVSTAGIHSSSCSVSKYRAPPTKGGLTGFKHNIRVFHVRLVSLEGEAEPQNS